MQWIFKCSMTHIGSQLYSWKCVNKLRWINKQNTKIYSQTVCRDTIQITLLIHTHRIFMALMQTTHKSFLQQCVCMCLSLFLRSFFMSILRLVQLITEWKCINTVLISICVYFWLKKKSFIKKFNDIVY